MAGLSPDFPPPQQPQFYPQPALAVRLVSGDAPPNAAPGSFAGPGSIPPSVAGNDGIPPPTASGSARKDDFYRYWDKFLNEDPLGRNVKKAKRVDVKRGGVVSLDTDVEGRPAHLTRINSKGVVGT